MTDIIEQAALAIWYADNDLEHVGLADGRIIAQVLADVGLLAQPERILPHRDVIAELIGEFQGDVVMAADYEAADAILALFGSQPTVAEAKAQALEEARRTLETEDHPFIDGDEVTDISNWLEKRATAIRAGETV